MSDSEGTATNDMPPVKSAWGMVDEVKKRIDNLSPEELQAEIAAGTAIAIDIRDYREVFAKGKVPGSVHAPRGMLEFWIDPASEYYRDVFRSDKRYIIYCAGGGRSALAAGVMKDMGYPDVGQLEPGFGGWLKAGLETESIQETGKWVPRDSK